MSSLSTPTNPHFPSWTKPRRFSVPDHFVLFFGAAWVAQVIAQLVVPGAKAQYPFGPAGAVMLLGLLLWAGYWLLRGGGVTVDPFERVIRWRRPLSFGRLAGEWRFDEITGATAQGGQAAQTVTVHFGERRLTFKVKRWSARDIATSLRAVAAEQVRRGFT